MDTKRYTRFVAMSLVALSLAGCATAATPAPTAVPLAPTVVPATPKPALDVAVVVDKYVKALPDGWSGIAPAALKDQIAAAKPFIVDVREPSEIAANGFIEGAVNIPIRTLTKNLDKLPAKDAPIVVYCAIGHRGALAMTTLQMLGYTNVKSVSNGFNAWVAAKLPVATGATADLKAGVAPVVDSALFAVLDKYIAGLPDGFNLIAPLAAKDQLAAAKPFLLDVREASELTANGYIEGAVNIPIRTLTSNLNKLPAKDQPIIVYCGIGHRGGIVLESLTLLGYTNVKSISGGFTAWN
ncbi:MAG: rhodanese-like domain-containing protein, partial [Thermoflexales bacterium]